MNLSQRRLLFLFFFLSGFSSLAYQIIWTRMAFASFGVITPVLSVVLSVFMLGLALGAWVGGKFIGPLVGKTGRSAIAFYAGAELLIGLGAFAVPQLFALGEHLLLAAGQSNSVTYLLLSALVLGASILPWCVFMGATFPLMMAYVREWDQHNAESFSFLYLANVLGAMTGTLLTAVVLIETLGFRHTLWVAAASNFSIALISGWLARKRREQSPAPASKSKPQNKPASPSSPSGNLRPQAIRWILFATGFCAMAMEVVWTRAFAPILTTQVYSFAAIVFVYLGATFLGSFLYRRSLRKNSVRPTAELLAFLTIAAFLPILANDPRLVTAQWDGTMDVFSVVVVLASICPFCAGLGYLTPNLIDHYAAGHPTGTSRAYAINVLGCILGPLLTSYVLLPRIGQRYALLLLGFPFLIFHLAFQKSLPRVRRMAFGLTAGATLAAALFYSADSEEFTLRTQKDAVVRRDHVASVVSLDQGGEKILLVNGIGMSRLTTITKYMSHLPLAFHAGQPKSALMICFGMGTSYRSALSWDIETTAVELVPSVRDAFGFYHADAAPVMANPQGQVVIDDGRRYLKRVPEKFDVIAVDPPPPVEAACSSLLFSREFFELAKAHLNSNGILQVWFPGGENDLVTASAIARSLQATFPHVRSFLSIEGWGVHFLASMEPIKPFTATELAAHLPPSAQADLLEWSASASLVADLGKVLANEFPLQDLFNSSANPNIQITDDNPCNEYYLLRRWRNKAN